MDLAFFEINAYHTSRSNIACKRFIASILKYNVDDEYMMNMNDKFLMSFGRYEIRLKLKRQRPSRNKRKILDFSTLVVF